MFYSTQTAKARLPGTTIPPASEKERRGESLVGRCQSGDTEAWDLLICHYRPDIYRIAYSLSHNFEDAEDVTSQVLLRLYQSLHTFRNRSHFPAWLFSVIYHTFLDSCIRPSHRIHCMQDEYEAALLIHDVASTPESACLNREAAQILTSEIGHMPKTYRQVLALYYDEERTYQEISVEVGIAVGTVKSRLNRARRMLRKRLVSSYPDFAVA